MHELKKKKTYNSCIKFNIKNTFKNLKHFNEGHNDLLSNLVLSIISFVRKTNKTLINLMLSKIAASINHIS